MAEEAERVEFTDEEAAFLRHARFGELPPRVLPAERVELVETDAKRDIPEPSPMDVHFYGYYQP